MRVHKAYIGVLEACFNLLKKLKRQSAYIHKYS
jgi:hypothetical protein